MSTDARDSLERDSTRYTTGLHWITLVGPTVIALALISGGAAMVVHAARPVRIWERSPIETGWLGIGIIIAGVLIAGQALLRRESTQLTVNDQRVTVSKGIFERTSLDILLSKVESIEVDQGVWGRLLDFGSITVRGTGGTPEPVSMIAHPFEFRQQVQSRLTIPLRPATAGESQ